MKTKMVTGVVFYSKRDAADYNLQPDNEKSLLRFGKDYRLSANFKKPTVWLKPKNTHTPLLHSRLPLALYLHLREHVTCI